MRAKYLSSTAIPSPRVFSVSLLCEYLYRHNGPSTQLQECVPPQTTQRGTTTVASTTTTTRKEHPTNTHTHTLPAGIHFQSKQTRHASSVESRIHLVQAPSKQERSIDCKRVQRKKGTKEGTRKRTFRSPVNNTSSAELFCTTTTTTTTASTASRRLPLLVLLFATSSS